MNLLKKIMADRQDGSPSLSLRGRLQAYLALLVFVLFFYISFSVFYIDIFPLPKETIKIDLEKGLNSYKHNISSYFNNTAAHCIRFSEMATRQIEALITQENVSFSDFADNQTLIEKLQQKTYDLLYRNIVFSDCSGAFIIFDTTVNTQLPDSDNSRSGMYLKLINLNTPTPDNHDMAWVRGIVHIGTQNNHFFHNKWELEFSLKNLPFYKKLKDYASPHLEECFFLSPRVKLPGTWESMLFLCVPLVGRNGEFYGICGLEVSSMHFKLTHLVGNGDDARLTGLVARRKDEWLLPATGVESGTASGYYAGLDTAPLRVENISDGLNRYISPNRAFIGIDSNIKLSPLFPDEIWNIAYFIPEQDYKTRFRDYYIKAIVSCIAFIFIALVVSYLLTRRYVDPLLNSIDAVKKGSATQTNIAEIDDLIRCLNQKNIDKTSGTEVDMTGFYTFKENIKKLSPAERLVFNLYLEGFSAPKIAETLCLSIHTVKSHNKNIYAKLGVSSRKELMIYIRMLKGSSGDEQIDH